MDVHYGPEVIALDPFDPHPFYISEKSNEAYTQAILNEHAQTNPNIQLIKKSPEKTITQVSRNGILGLIAWTNIFYDRLDADRLTFIAKQASPILHQDGIFIASAFDAGQAHHPTLRPAFEIAAQQLKTDPNCRFTLMITQQTTLGEYFLIGQPR